MTARVAVIGGGLAGLACAGVLSDAGFGVTVFDKGRAVGGRTSTRREGNWSFDHGAPRLDIGAPELAADRASWETAGVVAPWEPSVDQPGAARPRSTWIGVPGSSALARYLATRIEVETSARVVSLSRRAAARSSYDAVTSVFMFHELPRRARRNVLSEAFRVLRPGGLLVIEDSSQHSDAPELREVLDAFPREFHEPYDLDCLADPLPEIVRDAGFVVEVHESHMVATVVAARKPGYAA